MENPSGKHGSQGIIGVLEYQINVAFSVHSHETNKATLISVEDLTRIQTSSGKEKAPLDNPKVLFYRGGRDRAVSEQSTSNNSSDFLQQIIFPQRAILVRITDPDRILAFR
jgi:hypothetical protein